MMLLSPQKGIKRRKNRFLYSQSLVSVITIHTPFCTMIHLFLPEHWIWAPAVTAHQVAVEHSERIHWLQDSGVVVAVVAAAADLKICILDKHVQSSWAKSQI